MEGIERSLARLLPCSLARQLDVHVSCGPAVVAVRVFAQQQQQQQAAGVVARRFASSQAWDDPPLRTSGLACTCHDSCLCVPLPIPSPHMACKHTAFDTFNARESNECNAQRPGSTLKLPGTASLWSCCLRVPLSCLPACLSACSLAGWPSCLAPLLISTSVVLRCVCVPCWQSSSGCMCESSSAGACDREMGTMLSTHLPSYIYKSNAQPTTNVGTGHHALATPLTSLPLLFSSWRFVCGNGVSAHQAPAPSPSLPPSVPHTTTSRHRSLSPVWYDHDASLRFVHWEQEVCINVFDAAAGTSEKQHLATRTFPVARFDHGQSMNQWVDLIEVMGEEAAGEIERDERSIQIRIQMFTSNGKEERFRLPYAAEEPEHMTVFPQETSALSLFVTTWNVGNEPPPLSLTDWMPTQGYDLFVIGAQECTFTPCTDISGRPLYASTESAWVGCLTAHLSHEYVLVSSLSLREIRLVIFARASCARHIKNVTTDTVATGIGDVVGNKGGTVISFDYAHTRLCFVNCHLAAHQDMTTARNADMCRVIKSLKYPMGKRCSGDLLTCFHHVFVLGDLNYRLSFGTQGEARKPDKETFTTLCRMIRHKRYAELMEMDQLKEQQRLGQVLPGFVEGKYAFAPSFKVHRNERLTYSVKRSPAWCDRILWYSLAPMPIQQKSLTMATSVVSSDHKPVCSTFTLDVFRMAGDWDYARARATIQLCKWKSDELDRCNDAPITVELRASYLVEPLLFKWSEVNTMMQIPVSCNNPARLARELLYIRVWKGSTHAKTSEPWCSGKMVLASKGKLSERSALPLLWVLSMQIA